MFTEMMMSSGSGDSGIRETFWSIPVTGGYGWNISSPDDTTRTGSKSTGEYLELISGQALKAKKDGTYIYQTRTGDGTYPTTVSTFSAGATIISNIRNGIPHFVAAMDS
jgi:hypothetical protein